MQIVKAIDRLHNAVKHLTSEKWKEIVADDLQPSVFLSAWFILAMNFQSCKMTGDLETKLRENKKNGTLFLFDYD